MSEKTSTSIATPGRLSELAREFLRLGSVAFGGPAAHIAMMEDEFVRRRSWVTRERFLDLVGAVSLLPGPNSTELAIYLGEIRAGLAGLILAGVCFILPSSAMVAILAWAYVKYGAIPQAAGFLFGIKPVVVAVIAQAIWKLAPTALKSVSLALLAALVIVLSVFGVPALLLLLGAGIAWIIWRQAERLAENRTAIVGLIGTGGTSAAGLAGAAPLFLYFLKVGAILFGSGYVLLAFLRADLVVRLHWLNDAQLLDAIAVSQATPGPLSTVATFIGYLLAGWKGALFATVGMFLPAFVFVGATASFLPKLRKSPVAGAFLDGVNAAALALMAFVGWQFARAALVNVPAIVLAGVSALLLFRFRVNSAWLLIGGAIAGILLRSLGWA